MPSRRRTAHAGRVTAVAAVTVTALTAAFVQPLAAGAATPPAPPSDAKLAAEPARHDLTREQFYGTSAKVKSNSDSQITVIVPAGSSIVLKAADKLTKPTTKPSVTLKAPATGATGTVDITADDGGTSRLSEAESGGGGQLKRVVFAAQIGNGKWRTLGSADHAPYKVTQTIGEDVPAGTALRY